MSSKDWHSPGLCHSPEQKSQIHSLPQTSSWALTSLPEAIPETIFTCRLLSLFALHWIFKMHVFSRFRLTLMVLRSTRQGFFFKCPSVGICLVFFSWLDWNSVFLGENERGKVPFRHIPPSARADDTNTPWRGAGPGPAEAVLSFSHFPLPAVQSAAGSRFVGPTPEQEGLRLPLAGATAPS